MRDELALAIELTLDFGGVPKWVRFLRYESRLWFYHCFFLMWNVLICRQLDIEILSKFILSEAVPLNLRVTKIAYKLLNLLGFQSNANDDGMQNLLKLCFDTLIHIYSTCNLVSAHDSNESTQLVILLLRICSNIVALHAVFGEFIILNWFQSQNRSMSSFFNHFIQLLTTNGLSVDEIFWFIGNLLKGQTNSESTAKYLECDDFFKKLHTNRSNWKIQLNFL